MVDLVEVIPTGIAKIRETATVAVLRQLGYVEGDVLSTR